ncbi:MAG: 4-(cytidine 5'-diphospho)-2-C-methyl-D-erythritol kinase [Alphaproteobacteria bacterium]|nr:4-(cytidine 5'-diphospho)-2-C-methyl-D-erythritol kinase [Alphaproteobacteria bacterium]
MQLSLSAPAKINLFLHVTGRRPDGYHRLQSLVVFTELADELRAAPHEDLTLEITGAFAGMLAGAQADNLVVRAAEALRRAAHVRQGAALTLEKRLPVAAGIGGGSADAAATLRLLPRLWKKAIDEQTLQSAAAALGSDVPACLLGRSCMMEEKGEQLTPLRLPFTLPLVLVNPGVPVATAEVFARVRPPYREILPHPPRFQTAEALVAWLGPLANDLEPPALALHPVIADALAALRAQEGCMLWRMCGSGATCVGIFSDAAAARAAEQRLSGVAPRWWVRYTQTREER